MKTLEIEEEPLRPICQDCGQEAVVGYVAGDTRCARMIRRRPRGPWVYCYGRLRLDNEEEKF